MKILSNFWQFTPHTAKRLAFIIFCLIQFSCNIPFACFSTIWIQVAQLYKTNSMNLYWTANIGYLTFPIQILCFKPIYQNSKLIIQLAALANVIGALFLQLTTPNFFLLILGYGLISICQLLTFSQPIFIAHQWFEPNQQVLVTCIGTIMSLLGQAFGQIFIQFTFNGSDSLVLVEQSLDLLFLINTIIAFIALALSLIMQNIKNQENDYNQSLLSQFREIASSSEKVFNIIGFGIYIAFGQQYMMLLSIQLTKSTYFEVGVINTVFQVSGLAISVLVGLKLDQETRENAFPSYDFYLKWLTGITFVLLIIQTLFSDLTFHLYIGFNLLIPMGIYCAVPLCLLSMSNIYANQDPLFLAGCTFIIASWFQVFMQYLMTFQLISKYSMVFVLVLITPFQLYLLIFYKTKFNRIE